MEHRIYIIKRIFCQTGARPVGSKRTSFLLIIRANDQGESRKKEEAFEKANCSWPMSDSRAVVRSGNRLDGFRLAAPLCQGTTGIQRGRRGMDPHSCGWCLWVVFGGSIY